MTGVNGQVVLDHFNPRPREEGDRMFDEIVKKGGISIHALVKRATEKISR